MCPAFKEEMYMVEAKDIHQLSHDFSETREVVSSNVIHHFI